MPEKLFGFISVENAIFASEIVGLGLLIVVFANCGKDYF